MMTQQDIQFLYKYYPFNDENFEYIEKIFTHNELYFPSPRKFNDPFDSKIRLNYDGTEDDWRQCFMDLFIKFAPQETDKQRNAEIEKIIEERRYESIPESLSYSEMLDEMGVFCMSEINNHLLMWAHYCEGHTGFCLEFLATSITPFFGRAQKMDYSNIYPKINFFKNSREEHMKAILLTKAKVWEYEREWRIVEHDKGPGIHKFPEELLVGVILGCKMSENNKQKIRKLAMNRRLQPKLYQAEIRQNEFRIDIK